MSIVSAVPWLSVDARVALAVQFVLFECAAVGLALWYDIWGTLPAATVAIGIATAGSGLMLYLTERIRTLAPPERYRTLLFHSSIDVVMGLVAFVALVTYLFLDARGPRPGLLERLVGESLPAPAVFFCLLVAWDLCYRIGTGWWASVTGLWRSVAYGAEFDASERRAWVRADLLTIAFAGLQLWLVPFLWAEKLLAVLVLGHVVAVVVVSGLSVAFGVRR